MTQYETNMRGSSYLIYCDVMYILNYDRDWHSAWSYNNVVNAGIVFG